MPTKSGANLGPELDRLYQAPLDDFVRLREEIAAQVRAEGAGADALQVHALAKPPLSAWAVNQLYWRARPEFDALMAAGRALRSAQQATMKGRQADLREATRHRDAALVAALQRTIELLEQEGHSLTPSMRLRVATNLEALAAYGGAAPGTVPGRLATDLDPPGFEVLAGMASRGDAAERRAPEPRKPRRAAGKVVSFEAIAAARREVAEAERLLSERRATAQQAETLLEQARREHAAAEAELALAKAALEDAARRVEQAQRKMPEREREAGRRRAEADEARSALERARQALEDLKNKK